MCRGDFMKKTILSILSILLVLAGCTSKEQNEKIRAYWQEQAGSLVLRGLAMRPTQAINPLQGKMPPVDANGNPLFTPQEQTETQDPQMPKPEDATQTQTAPKREPIKAVLFVHSDSPVCKQLKADQWDTSFQQTYQGKVTLVQYDMKNPASKTALQEQMKKHKLSSVPTPALFIGNHVLTNYPFQGVDKAVQEALMAPATLTRTANRQGKKQSSQYMEIVMEKPVKETVNTKASAKDRKAMETAFATVQADNQKTLSDIEMMFGASTRAQAVSIINENEHLLKNKMGTSATYKAYLSAQARILKAQEQQLNELMQRNARNIRSI